MTVVDFKVGAGLEIRDVTELRTRLLTALGEAGSLRVDLSAVIVADTAGAQLLLALRKETAQRGIELQFNGWPDVVGDTFTALGLDPLAPRIDPCSGAP